MVLVDTAGRKFESGLVPEPAGDVEIKPLMLPYLHLKRGASYTVPVELDFDVVILAGDIYRPGSKAWNIQQDNRLNEEAVRELAELAFFRTDAGFLYPERAAAVYVKESKSPVPATPWMLDLRALTSASRDMALAGR